MKSTIRGLLVATAALCALASNALAQTQTGLSIKDGNGTGQNLCTFTVGSNQASCNVNWTYNSSTGWNVAPADSSGRPYFASPVGALGDLGVGGQLHTDLTTLNNSVNSPPPLGTSGGWTPKLLNALTSGTPVSIKGAAGQLSTLQCFNPNASQIYVLIFDSASAPTYSSGWSVAPKLSVPIAATATGGFALSGIGVQFANGIFVVAETTATGNTAPGTAPDCNAIYN